MTYLLNVPPLLFADDLKVFLQINSIQDCVRLQETLNHIEHWCNLNKLYLNIAKCKICTYTLKFSPIEFNYSNVKDLGTFDNKFTFSDHILNINNSSLKMLGFLIRNCKSFKNMDCLKTLYFTLVRSKLEYGALIWNPNYNIHINLIERTQRRFLKFLCHNVNGVHPERGFDNRTLLLMFNVPSLKQRRDILSLKFLFNLFHNKIDCPDLLSQFNLLVPRASARSSLYFYSFARTNVVSRSPVSAM